MSLKLQQGQVWRTAEGFIRIVRVARLEVDYKLTSAPAAEGTHHHVSKKEFCRLLKSATLVPPPGSPAAPR